MHRKKIFSWILLAGISITFVQAQQAKNGQWESLFNGKDLKGFKQLNGKAKYTVENGEIVGRTVVNEPNSFLATEKQYGDFILEIDFKVHDSMNSGIQFRSEIKDANDQCKVDTRVPDRVHGYQLEIDPSDRGWSGGIYDEARRGWLYSMENNPAAKTAFKHNQWNHYRVECIGNSIRTWVNGIPCAHLIDDMTPKGFIALQVHAIGQKQEQAGREIRWRNIRIQTKNLKPSPDDNVFVVSTLVNALSDDEKRLGVRLLWDGKTTDGWRGAGKDQIPKAWVVNDGALSITANHGAPSQERGDIITKEKFSAFDLQFEFRLTDTANSGVKYFVVEKTSAGTVGLEFQVLDDDKHPDAKLGSIGNRTTASLYDLIPAKKNGREKLPIGEWNRARITVFPDGRVEHWLNGWKVLEYQRGTQYYYALVAKSKYANIKDFGMAASGHILLQDHGNNVSFRSFKIKELK